MGFGEHAIEIGNNLADAYHGPWARDPSDPRMGRMREAVLSCANKRIRAKPDETTPEFLEWIDLLVAVLKGRGVPVPGIDPKTWRKGHEQAKIHDGYLAGSFQRRRPHL